MHVTGVEELTLEVVAPPMVGQVSALALPLSPGQIRAPRWRQVLKKARIVPSLSRMTTTELGRPAR